MTRIQSHNVWLSLIDGHSTETAIVDYRLSFASQGKKIFRFLFLVCRKQTEIADFCWFCFPPKETWRHRHVDMERWRHGYGDIKWKMENGSRGDFLNPFTVCSSCKRKFVVCPFVDEETSGSYPFANGLGYLWLSFSCDYFNPTVPMLLSTGSAAARYTYGSTDL
jgi:hypothetical protein